MSFLKNRTTPGSACCYLNRYGTPCSPPAQQGRPAPPSRVGVGTLRFGMAMERSAATRLEDACRTRPWSAGRSRG